jgi:hypothetical protein
MQVLVLFACILALGNIGTAWGAGDYDNLTSVESLRAVGAHFEYDHQGLITEVVLGGKTTDDVLANLTDLPHLERLILQCALRVTDDGLVHLEGLRQLKFLWFGYSNITDNGLVHLKDLSNLEELFVGVHRSEFGSDGLVHLRRLKNLRTLTLLRTKVTQNALDDLKTYLPECTIKTSR